MSAIPPKRADQESDNFQLKSHSLRDPIALSSFSTLQNVNTYQFPSGREKRMAAKWLRTVDRSSTDYHQRSLNTCHHMTSNPGRSLPTVEDILNKKIKMITREACPHDSTNPNKILIRVSESKLLE